MSAEPLGDYQQPQSDEEIRPFVEALRRLDAWLDVRWEPKAHLVTRAQFGAFGTIGKAAVYRGRWQIIRYNTDRLHLDRAYAVIVSVTAFDGTTTNLMVHQGAYEPMSWRVVEYMQRFDAAQARFATEMDKVWQEHEKAEAQLAALVNDRDAHTEAAHRVYREHGGEYWMGGAQGKAHPDTVTALWGGTRNGKGRRSSDTTAPVSSSTP